MSFFKSFAVFIVLFIFPNFLFSQNVKNESIELYEWHLPELVIPSQLKTYTIQYTNNNPILVRNVQDRKHAYKEFKWDKSNLVKKRLFNELNLETFEYVEDNADFVIKVKSYSNKIKIVSHALKKNNNVEQYKGVIQSVNELGFEITDAKGKVLSSFKEQTKNTIAEVAPTNEFPIGSEKRAVSLALQLFNREYKVYLNSALNYLLNNTVHNGAYKIKTLIDYYIEKNRVNFFAIKKADKYGLMPLNDQTYKIIELAEKEYDDHYQMALKQEAEKSIAFYEKLLQNVDKEDKSQKKVYWVLLSNLSASNYIIENYDKAIFFAKERENIKFRRGYILNRQVSESRKKIKAKHFIKDRPLRDFEHVNFRQQNIESLAQLSNQAEQEELLRLELKNYVEANILLKNKSVMNGYIKLNEESNQIATENFSSITFKTQNEKGAFVTEKIEASKVLKLNLGNEVYHSLPIRIPNSKESDVLRLSSVILGSANYFFATPIFESNKIAAYEYYDQLILKKASDTEAISTSSVGVIFSFNKKMIEFFGDCGVLVNEIEKGTYQNEKEDVLKMVKKYVECE